MDIFVFGDSISNGAYDTECSGWVDRLKMYAYKKGFESDWTKGGSVHNYSLDGGTTNDVMPLVEGALKLVSKKDVVVFAIGSNDAKRPSDGEVLLALDQFNENLENMIREALSKASRVFVVGFTRVDEVKRNKFEKYLPDEKPIYVYNADLEAYDRSLENISIQNDTTYIKVSDLSDPKTYFDGEHPDSQGHRLIFEQVRDILERENIL